MDGQKEVKLVAVSVSNLVWISVERWADRLAGEKVDVKVESSEK